MGRVVRKASTGQALRRSSTGPFVVLADGRKLVKPPSGGKFTKRQIAEAVKRVLRERDEAATSA